jgi:cytochrome c peroxidase
LRPRQGLTPIQAAETPLIAKGRAPFNDPKLSGDGKASCASCHPNHGHTNNKTYVGMDVVRDGDPNGRSTPTLWGVGTRHAFSWAGTAPSLQANILFVALSHPAGIRRGPAVVRVRRGSVRRRPFPNGEGQART